MACRLVRLLASGLIFNATFPLDALTAPRLIDAAQDAGFPGEMVGAQPIPYEGSYFHILSGQGPNADGGIKSYPHSGRRPAVSR